MTSLCLLVAWACACFLVAGAHASWPECDELRQDRGAVNGYRAADAKALLPQTRVAAVVAGTPVGSKRRYRAPQCSLAQVYDTKRACARRAGGTHDTKPPPVSDINGPRPDYKFEQRVAELGREVQFLPSGNHTEWVEEMKRDHDDYCASLSGGQLVKMELIRSVLLRVPSLSRPTPQPLAPHRHFSRRMHPRAGRVDL